jgi:hypothetical protein
LLLVVIIVTEDKEKNKPKRKKMVILRQQSEFVISGDIEQIKAELAKGPSEEKPDENSQGVYVGKFYPEIVFKNGQELTLPGCDIKLSNDHIGARFPVGVCFFKEEDEKLYAAIISYITHIVKEELNKI